MKPFRDYFRNYIILNEFTQATIDKLVKKFEKEAPKEQIERELKDFEKYKASLELKDPFQYKTWVDLTQAVHGAKGESQFKNKKKLDKDDTQRNYEDKGADILAEDDNVIIYKGDSQDKCVLLGNGYPFCISRQLGGNMYNDYRLTKESSFYFIFFKKKPRSARDHIMVLDHRNDGYEWTFAENVTKRVHGGWDEIAERYPELAPYENLFEKMPLTQEERELNERIDRFVNVLNVKDPKTFEQMFEYKERPTVLKRMFSQMTDGLWDSLDSFLRNEFLGSGPNLSPHMISDLKPNEREYYKKRRDLMMKQTLSQLDPDDEGEAEEVIDEISLNDLDSDQTIDYLLEHPAGYKAIYGYFMNKVRYGTSYKDLDQNLLYELLTNRATSYNTARYIIGIDNLDADMKESILDNMSTIDATNYAVDVLKGKNVPDKIIDKMVKSRYGISRFGEYYKEVLELPASKLPPYLLQLAMRDNKVAEEIYLAYDGKDLPEGIVKRAKNY